MASFFFAHVALLQRGFYVDRCPWLVFSDMDLAEQ